MYTYKTLPVMACLFFTSNIWKQSPVQCSYMYQSYLSCKHNNDTAYTSMKGGRPGNKEAKQVLVSLATPLGKVSHTVLMWGT